MFPTSIVNAANSLVNAQNAGLNDIANGDYGIA
jgi:hypothetical protein